MKNATAHFTIFRQFFTFLKMSQYTERFLIGTGPSSPIYYDSPFTWKTIKYEQAYVDSAKFKYSIEKLYGNTA